MYIYIYVQWNQNTESGMQGEAEHVVNNMMFDFSNGVYICPKTFSGQIFWLRL